MSAAAGPGGSHTGHDLADAERGPVDDEVAAARPGGVATAREHGRRGGRGRRLRRVRDEDQR